MAKEADTTKRYPVRYRCGHSTSGGTVNRDSRDTEQQKVALRNTAAARKVRERFPVGTRITGRVGGQFGTVERHVPGTDAQGGVLVVKWDNGITGRTVAGSLIRAEEA